MIGHPDDTRCPAAVIRRPRPRPLTGPETLARRHAHEAFVARVLSWHRTAPLAIGQAEMCACGAVAVLCPYRRLAHELLGHPVAGVRQTP